MKIKAGPIDLPGSLPEARRSFFARAVGRAFECRAGDDVAEIDLYDEIGYFGVTAKMFRNRLNAINASTIRLRINSPGGDVFDGIAMHNDLLAHRARIVVEVTGLAASAASIVAMAGDEITIADNAFVMIHNAWGIVLGNRHELAEFAETLGKIDAALARTYAARTELDLDDVVALMDAETWLDAREAVEKGFADEATEPLDVSARFDLAGFRNVPQALPAFAKSERTPATPRDLERSLRDAGFSRSEARAAVNRAFPRHTEGLWDAGDTDGLSAALQQLHRTLEKAK